MRAPAPEPGRPPVPALVAALLLIVALAGASAWRVQAADAAATGPWGSAPVPRPLDVEAEVEGEAEEEEEGGEAEEGSEQGEEEAEGESEEEEEEEFEGEGEAARCGLLSLDGEALAAGQRLRLTLRYSTVAGGEATVHYSARGPRGGLGSAPIRRRLSLSGTLKLSRRLSPAETRRIHAARSFTVRLELAGDGAPCAAAGHLLLGARGGSAHAERWSEGHGGR
jgi:hypothetical protein